MSPSDLAGASARFRRHGPGYEPERTGRHSYTVEIGYRKSDEIQECYAWPKRGL